MSGGRKGLTEKQKLFVREYLSNGRNGTAAYRYAFPNNMTPSQIYSAASRLKNHPLVAAKVAEADGAAQKAVALVIERYAVSQESIAKILITLAAYDPADIYDVRSVRDEAGNVVKDSDGRERKILVMRDLKDIGPRERMAISEVEIDGKGQTRIKTADRRQAAVDLAKLMGLITDKGQQAVDPVTGKPVDRFQPIELHIHRNGNGGSR